jgi:5'(3')-deoxyribonucleotidase
MTTVLLDIDDVCANLIEKWLHLYELPSHHKLDREDVTDWDLSKFVKPEFKEKIYQIIEKPQIYNSIKPIDGALEGYNYLKSKEYDILFATYSTKGCAGRKFDWLLENGFEVDHNDYIEIYRKELLDVDFMVDDNYQNVSKTSGVGILYNAPWNKKYEWSIRANNWSDIINIIEGKETSCIY